MSSSTWDKLAGKWKQFAGDLRTQWGEITDDEFEQMAGQRDKLEGKLQERYGITKEEARKQVDEWANKLGMD